MRYWIVEWLKTYPKVYNIIGPYTEFVEYCLHMEKRGTPGTSLELQVASDLFFATIEIFSIANLHALVPEKIVKPNQRWHTDPNVFTNKIKIICQPGSLTLLRGDSPLMANPFLRRN